MRGGGSSLGKGNSRNRARWPGALDPAIRSRGAPRKEKQSLLRPPGNPRLRCSVGRRAEGRRGEKKNEGCWPDQRKVKLLGSVPPISSSESTEGKRSVQVTRGEVGSSGKNHTDESYGAPRSLDGVGPCGARTCGGDERRKGT